MAKHLPGKMPGATPGLADLCAKNEGGINKIEDRNA